MSKSKTKRPVMTISPALHESWKKMQRHNDIISLSKYLGVSRPTISRALKHGHVPQVHLVQKITTFFIERMEREKNEMRDLEARAQSVTGA